MFQAWEVLRESLGQSCEPKPTKQYALEVCSYNLVVTPGFYFVLQQAG